MQGTDAPTDAHPSSIRRKDKAPVHTRVNLPRESRESEEWAEVAAELVEALDPIFTWLNELVRPFWHQCMELWR